MKKLSFLALLLYQFTFAQSPVLIGYWHNWNDSNAPYIALDQVDSRYNVVCVSFAVPTSASDMNMLFIPDGITQANFISQIQTLQNQGKKVLLSIGGATTSVSLNDVTNRNAFTNSMTSILNTYGFDGIDIDIEHGNSILASGTITNPTSADCINLIAAINQIKTNYYTTFNRTIMLTFAPETAYVQGGMSAYGGIWGGYLPLLHALRNDLNYVHVQLYNSGSVYGIDGNIYNQGSSDFIIAMTEALIQGFTTAGGMFVGLPENKVVIGLPACPAAAGGGYVAPANVAAAVNYLRGIGSKPGTYTLNQTSGYPNLGGLMTWSINWDKVATCNSTSYQYAQNYQSLFGTLGTNEVAFNSEKEIVYPNPATDKIYIKSQLAIDNYTISNTLGQIVQQGKLIQNEPISIENLQSNLYIVSTTNRIFKLLKK